MAHTREEERAILRAQHAEFVAVFRPNRKHVKPEDGLDEDACDDYAEHLSPSDIQTLDGMVKRHIKALHGMTIKEVTCTNCGAAPFCGFAFDTYNTDGDCLAAK